MTDLVADILNEQPLREHRFDWLRGDAGTRLPLDAYFPRHSLVLEYRERQHLADRGDTFRMWDSRPTVSGVPRRVQRATYDKRREEEIPRHRLKLMIVNADDLAVDRRGRLQRDVEADRQRLVKMLRSLGFER